MGEIQERLDDRLIAFIGRKHLGSGIETVAHLRKNGRITILFCAFEARAEIGLKKESGGDAVDGFENP